ncbi:uncharacterized protein STEHIDRAFT_142988 [Stereum hirsutum FP-91666 SS1]|uniref:Uncharacterized protein n=1 Tax=Stereum hirsutum (strain FP-91666) TaxID=721885 RepID=R7RZ61_STEHR|nr:uncharacterized protein STEHIDRAFT_142988 [Stereum hirsutum FP-91666 SS1]EIM80210.1 hypothetical protein STEHIDRAFT_142988 [Stereum hirsutum FP-91666 SS1]
MGYTKSLACRSSGQGTSSRRQLQRDNSRIGLRLRPERHGVPPISLARTVHRHRRPSCHPHPQPIKLAAAGSMDNSSPLASSSNSTHALFSSPPTPTPESFVFTSSLYIPSNLSPHEPPSPTRPELSHRLRTRHAEGAVDVKSTIPFSIGPNGFVRLMPSPYSPRSSPSDSPLNVPRTIDGTGSHLEDTSPALSLQGPTDYFSLRRPASYRSTQPIIPSPVSPTPSFYPSPSSALRAGITSNETLRWLRSTTNSDPISDSAFTSSSNLVLGTATSSSNATSTPIIGHPLDRASMALPALNHPLFPPEFDLSIVELMTLTRRYRRRAFTSRNRRVDETETSLDSLSSSLESQETGESDELMELPAGQEFGDHALVAETDEMESDVMSKRSFQLHDERMQKQVMTEDC